MTGPFDSVRRIFFDLDDTLCGYWSASKSGLRKAFEDHGPEGHTAEEMVEHWAAAFREFSPTVKNATWYAIYLKEGEPTRQEQMRLTLARVGVDDADRVKALSDAYASHRDAHLSLFEDARKVLETLYTRYPMGLITNGPADIQRQEIATLGIEPFFDRIYIEGEMGRGKPLPEVFSAITAEAELEPHQIAMVGNSYAHDIRPAIDAGWVGVWIRRPSDVPPSAKGKTSAPEERPEDAPAPHSVVTSLTEVLALFRDCD